MFTLNALFNHPGSFRDFVASSPSIWWNERSVLKDEPSFVRKIEAGEAAPRVLILVGSKEQEVPDRPLPGMTLEQMETMVSQWRMVDNARELGVRLQQVRGRAGYLVRFHMLEDDDHLTALPASIGQALSFALRP
jgi:predicted alpha/beta superfamily hydrolase